MREIGFQQPLDRFRRVFRLEIVIDLLPDIGVRTKAAASEQMIALDRVDILADIHFRGDQSDIADVVLSTGMMAAGDVDVERRIDIDARLAPVADLGSVPLYLPDWAQKLLKADLKRPAAIKGTFVAPVGS